MEGAAARCLAAFAALLAVSAAAGDISDKIAVWGYVLDKTPTSCPFMFGKTEFSLERAADEFGARKAFYMNSCFNREYVEGHFKYWEPDCLENCVDNRLAPIQMDKLRGMDEVWCATTHGDKLASAVAIAKLSLVYTNIVGVNFDDFKTNNSVHGMSVEKLKELKAAMHAVNPKLKVSVVSYAIDAHTRRKAEFRDLTAYRGEIDHVSYWKWLPETNYWCNLRAEIAKIRRQVGPKATIVHGLYMHDFSKDMKGLDPLPLDYFKFSVNAAFDAVADGTLDGVILPQAAWYLVPSHREHYEWLREKVRSFRAK